MLEIKKIQLNSLPVWSNQNMFQQEFQSISKPIEIYVNDFQPVSIIAGVTYDKNTGLPNDLDYVIQFGESEKSVKDIGGSMASVHSVLAPYFVNGRETGKVKISLGKGNVLLGHLIPIKQFNVEIMDN